MRKDLLQLIHRTRHLIESSLELCACSDRAIAKSKRLLEEIETTRTGSDVETQQHSDVKTAVSVARPNS